MLDIKAIRADAAPFRAAHLSRHRPSATGSSSGRVAASSPYAPNPKRGAIPSGSCRWSAPRRPALTPEPAP